MIKTDGIIFDMDGTIWDNTPLFAESWNKAAKMMGYETTFTKETLMSEFGKTMQEIADDIIPDEEPERRYKTLKLCEEVEMDDLRNSSEDTCYIGLEDTLRLLVDKGIKLYVVSNCQSGYIELYFEKSGHEKYFTNILCYGDNGLGKSDNLKKLVTENNIKAPVYVGDIQGDKNACDAANVPFIWASYGYGEKVDSYVAKIDDITELTNIVEKL